MFTTTLLRHVGQQRIRLRTWRSRNLGRGTKASSSLLVSCTNHGVWSHFTISKPSFLNDRFPRFDFTHKLEFTKNHFGSVFTFTLSAHNLHSIAPHKCKCNNHWARDSIFHINFTHDETGERQRKCNLGSLHCC